MSAKYVPTDTVFVSSSDDKQPSGLFGLSIFGNYGSYETKRVLSDYKSKDFTPKILDLERAIETGEIIFSQDENDLFDDAVCNKKCLED